MLAAWSRNDYKTISEMRYSFRFAAHVEEMNGGTAERLELLDQIGGALSEGPAVEADCASNRERLCAYIALLQHIGTSPC